MGDLFRPSARRGASLYGDLRCRLAASLRHIAEASRDYIDADRAAIDRQCGEIERAPGLRPDLFLIYHDLLGAARRSDVAALDIGFAELLQVAVAIDPETVRNYADASFTPAELDRYRRAFAEDDDAAIAFTPTNPGDFAQACTAFAGAKAVLAAADQELAGEIRMLRRHGRPTWDGGYDTLRRHGRPTALGQALLQSAAGHLA